MSKKARLRKKTRRKLFSVMKTVWGELDMNKCLNDLMDGFICQTYKNGKVQV